MASQFKTGDVNHGSGADSGGSPLEKGGNEDDTSDNSPVQMDGNKDNNTNGDEDNDMDGSGDIADGNDSSTLDDKGRTGNNREMAERIRSFKSQIHLHVGHWVALEIVLSFSDTLEGSQCVKLHLLAVEPLNANNAAMEDGEVMVRKLPRWQTSNTPVEP